MRLYGRRGPFLLPLRAVGRAGVVDLRGVEETYPRVERRSQRVPEADLVRPACIPSVPTPSAGTLIPDLPSGRPAADSLIGRQGLRGEPAAPARRREPGESQAAKTAPSARGNTFAPPKTRAVPARPLRGSVEDVER